MKNFLSLIIIIILTSWQLSAQEGVEIQLTEALVIQNGVSYGRNNFVNDPQALQILTGKFERPVEGQSLTSEPGSIKAGWKKINADEKGYFRSEKLRGGGLYTEYESNKEKIMLLSASGHTMAFINGEPREGDHYDFNYSLQPVRINKGINKFYFTNGRYNRIRVSLIERTSDIIIKKKDLTLPDLIIEEPGFKMGSVTLINGTVMPIEGLKIRCSVDEMSMITELPAIEKMTTGRMSFKIPVPEGLREGEESVLIEVLSSGGEKYDEYEFALKVKHFSSNHDRTFVSNIDGSIQYYSVTPGINASEENQALFLSVHGAGVQARNQAWTYDAKEWGHIVAPTNRGPFGFAWEDWGRLDALEVLNEGKELFNTDPSRTYLTGHSMGGHGTWYLGATYPSDFAAIAPCAGYPDLLNYAARESSADNNKIKNIFDRAGNPSRTLKLARNYLHHGIFVYHGDADPTVSVEQARRMRKVLGEFHPDFTYYEYPGGTHWYGDISMDWPPIFEYFKLHEIPDPGDVNEIEFYTANPGVSARSNWVVIYQQAVPLKISNIKASIDREKRHITINTSNIRTLGIDVKAAGLTFPITVSIDNKQIQISSSEEKVLYFKLSDGQPWKISPRPSLAEKGPHRYGSFKDAFRKNMVYVYGTAGKNEENRWNYLKARFDAETFSYRGNGSVEIVTDKEFLKNDYKGRNIIIYGNANNNRAWGSLLAESPVKVLNNEIIIGNTTLKGDDIACYFIQPVKNSDDNTIAVIAGTGVRGMKAAYPNQYFIAGSSFPDLTVFRMPGKETGYETVECAGFFGNDWSFINGDFEWKNESKNGR